MAEKYFCLIKRNKSLSKSYLNDSVHIQIKKNLEVKIYFWMKIWLTFSLKTYRKQLLQIYCLWLHFTILSSNFHFHVLCDHTILPWDWGWYGRLLICFTSKRFARSETKLKSEKMLHVESEILYHLNCMQLNIIYQNVKSCHILILNGSCSYWFILKIMQFLYLLLKKWMRIKL